MDPGIYFSTNLTNFLFHGLTVSSTGGIIGISIMTGFIPILSESLHLLREILAKRRLTSLDVNNVGSETVHLRTGLKPFSILNRSIYLSVQGFLYMLELLCFYLVMLALSTYNAWLFVALIIGTALAYLTLQPAIQLINENQTKTSLGIQSNYSTAALDSLREDQNADNLPSVSSCH
ncbi:hypothetical protein CHUAL_006109 [Chamberlinius hualienensis]